MTEFVTARHKGVLQRIRVPKRSLKFMPGWEVVPEGAAKPKRRRRKGASQTPQQRPVEAPAETETPDSPADTTESPVGGDQS